MRAKSVTPFPVAAPPDAQSRSVSRPLLANAPIILADPGRSIVVVEGTVDVFAVRLRDGKPDGPRHPVFRAVSGDVVIGLPGVGDLTLLLVGGLGAQVREGEPDGQHPPDALDRFILGLSGVIERARPAGDARVLDPGETVSVPAGLPVLSFTRMPLWIEAEMGGDPMLLGMPDMTARRLPVTHMLWATLQGEAMVSARTTAELIARPDWPATLHGCLDVLARALERCIAAQAELDLARIDGLRGVEAAALSASLRAMADVLEPDNQLEPESVTADPLEVAFRLVMRHLGVSAVAAPGTANGGHEDPARRLDALAHRYGARTRKVLLRGEWWRAEGAPLIGFLAEGGDPVAFVPNGAGGFRMIAPATGENVPVTRAVAERLSPEAVMAYPPLPPGAGSLGGLVRFILPMVRGDLRRLAAVGVIAGAMAAVVPMLTAHLFESVLPRAALGQHAQVVLALLLIALGAGAFEMVKVVALLRMENRADLMLQAALFDRLLKLPTGFHRRYTTGDLTDRVLGIQTIRQTVTGTTLASLLGLIFSVFSLAVLFYYDWRLALVALCIVVIAALLIVLLGRLQLRQEHARMKLQGGAEGFVLQMISAIGKLRAAGAERRAFARWAVRQAAQKRRYVAAQQVANLQELLQAVLPVLAAAIIFAVAASFLEDALREERLYGLLGPQDDPIIEPMTTGEFVGFNAAFGQFLLAMTTLVTALTRVLAMIPVFERLRPILEQEVEDQVAHRRAVGTLKGAIEVNAVRFGYVAGGRPVLDDLSLSIAPKEFVAIVGPSGSGKSTLVRLLLGFETPERGEVLYDGAPMHGFDLAGLRAQVQVVLQHARLSGGSLYSNIAGGRPLDEETVWRAIRQVGLDTDVEALPMGLHTVVTEGVNTFSGGQRQRLMLARALVRDPAILILDEPTSALDNTTQELVMNALTHVNATRIVIAHRLSTVRHADRILVMEAGRVVESGRFDELMERDGAFARLAQRQQL